MYEPPQQVENIEELIKNSLNLQSTNNILDIILNSLQGLTPEQEAQKKLIEEKTKYLKQLSEQNLTTGNRE